MLIKSQSDVYQHTGCSVHFHPSPFTRHSFSVFQGSGSKTTPYASSPRIPGLYRISKALTILKWWTIPMINSKLLEKQRVDRLAPYEVHIHHFFFSFRNHLTLSIFRVQNFSLDRQTGRQTKQIAQPFHACARGNYILLH